jgi:hypothetical protein
LDTPPQQVIDEVVKYVKQAWATGQELRFPVIKRPTYHKWRIYLTNLVASGTTEELDDLED